MTDTVKEQAKFEAVDVFQWANNTDAFKNELELELFVFNKNLTPYSLQIGADLMTDDTGAIILMDVNDVKVFLDILLDNFVHGSTGIPYVAKTKKELEPQE